MEANQKAEREMWKEKFLCRGALALFRSSGGRCSVGAHICGGAALVSDSHAPRRRRCAPEAWDDTEVIPPFGTKGAPTHEPQKNEGLQSEQRSGESRALSVTGRSGTVKFLELVRVF